MSNEALIHRSVIADAHRQVMVAARALKQLSVGSDAIVTPRDAQLVSKAIANLHAALARIPDRSVMDLLVKEMP